MSIAFKGGTAAQQNLITQAHNKAVVAIGSSMSNSLAQAGDFSTWFGSTNELSTAGQSSSTVYSVMKTYVNNTAFTYDLTHTALSKRAQDVYLNVPDFSDGAITLIFWVDFWDTFQTDTATAQRFVSLSIIYIASIFSNSEQRIITDQSDILNDDDARFIAEFRAGQTLTSPLNYMYYAQAYLP